MYKNNCCNITYLAAMAAELVTEGLSAEEIRELKQFLQLILSNINAIEHTLSKKKTDYPK